MMRLRTLSEAISCAAAAAAARSTAAAAAAAAAQPMAAFGDIGSQRSLHTSRPMSPFETAFQRSPAGQESKKMFCFQCEQTAGGKGCTVVGNCGKTAEVAGLQDLLIFSLKGLGHLAHLARQAGVEDTQVNSFIHTAMFSTLTNVNFDDSRFHALIDQCTQLHKRLSQRLAKAGKSVPEPPSVPWFANGMPHPVTWNQQVGGLILALFVIDLVQIASLTGIAAQQRALGATVAGLQELVMYGLKGLCAYFVHAQSLGVDGSETNAFVQEALWFLGSPGAADQEKLLDMAVRVGQHTYRVLGLLNDAHCSTFGHPEPTEVSVVPEPGRCILVTGHDLQDLRLLLEQTEGKGINVYTHGEMLPAHGYPGLKRFKHLKGHLGGAWYKQKMDFSYFPGSILVTTNCVMEPLSVYKRNVFTTNATGLPGIPHVDDKRFKLVIDRALQLPGFTPESCLRAGSMMSLSPQQATTPSSSRLHSSKRAGDQPAKTTLTVGWGHRAIMNLSTAIVSAVKEKQLKHIFVVGGCDGRESERSYYSRLGEVLPPDTLIMTQGCGKFRLIDKELGEVAGTQLPRLLDLGQCNDIYSAVFVAQQLSKALHTDINSSDMPMSMDISWFEQKAISVLLALLALGVKNVRFGPVLPAFLTPEAVGLLVDRFKLRVADVANPEEDLRRMMQRS